MASIQILLVLSVAFTATHGKKATESMTDSLASALESVRFLHQGITKSSDSFMFSPLQCMYLEGTHCGVLGFSFSLIGFSCRHSLFCFDPVYVLFALIHCSDILRIFVFLGVRSYACFGHIHSTLSSPLNPLKEKISLASSAAGAVVANTSI